MRIVQMAERSIPLEEENQELNIPIKKNEEDTDKTDSNENGNNIKTSDCETHLERGVENIDQKEKTDISTLKNPACGQFTVNLIVEHDGPVQVTQFSFHAVVTT